MRNWIQPLSSLSEGGSQRFKLASGPITTPTRRARHHSVLQMRSEIPGTRAAQAAEGAGEGEGEKVELRIYNIDKYGLSKLGSKALRKDYNAIWHVAIGAFGSEFWFDHQINEESLDGIEVRFGYAPAEVVDLGKTSKTHKELQDFLVELDNKYNVETYDCFHHNCHNFAQEVAVWLTGNSIPQWCLDHGGEALSNLPAKDAETIRWASNKIAKIMMVSWGRYNKERFDRRMKNQKQGQGQAQAQ